ncbi:DUF3618 domain-containing protein [Conexibacter woesei]|uniref:DUF3618 domain-containing protein n=1 Tax=Conexibacter woesei (strain DSM 14684 / CCUG 47730 / CIP 108061 / JCM 11494 / NBRC 100937 / ID131577) TaxID=469383 RepID=D3FAZ6_CONWI|nr:DUF3618 domain-containing protein [Conexibacter woesei]ADB53188.1 hypothetical protein Cwoe_4775 [Conexibacter woesei DSM 14684]
MGEDARTNGTPALTIAVGDPERIRQQIETTRAELGDTVAALAVKADVRQHAHDRVEAIKQKALAKRDALRGRAQEANPGATETVTHASHAAAERARAHPLPLIAGAAVAAGFLLGRLTKR